MHVTVFSVWALCIRGRVDDEVVTGPAPSRMEVVTHEQACSPGLVKLCRGLVGVWVQTFPGDA
eukprot:1768808-Pyramimonas_sp.AAC.1